VVRRNDASQPRLTGCGKFLDGGRGFGCAWASAL
jgi:hypothetical protein